MEQYKKTAPEKLLNTRALTNISVLSELYQKLNKEIIRNGQSEELRKHYEKLDADFRATIKREAIDITF